MAQVSIADVDNLKDAYDALWTSLELARESLRTDVSELVSLNEKTSDVLSESSRVLEELLRLEEQQGEQLETLRAELEQAQAELQEAESDLSQAESDLSAAQLAVEHDENGQEIEPDTSAEEAEVAAAEANVESCRCAVAAAEERCREAERVLEETTDRRRKQEEAQSVSSSNDMRAKELQESFRASQNAGVAAIEHQVSLAAAKLQRAQQALEQYLSVNPAAAAFSAWVHWQPATGRPVTPKDIHDRLRLNAEQQNMLARYFYDRDPVFRRKIDDYRSRYDAAKGDAERAAILVQASRGGSGDLAERMVKFAFSPIGTVSTQDRRYVEDEHYTKIDLLVTDLKSPVILGKGDGMGAPAGGSLAVEVKTGHPNYLYTQKDHMQFQAAGHQDASASIVVCSEDIHGLSEEREEELRDALREAGSPIVGMLPRKDDLDATIWNLIGSGGKSI